MVKNDEPMICTIQWTEGLDVHPNQKRHTGMQKAATNAGGSLFSGFSSLFSLDLGSVYLCRYKKKDGTATNAPTRMPMNAKEHVNSVEYMTSLGSLRLSKDR